jgi:SAUR family protein
MEKEKTSGSSNKKVKKDIFNKAIDRCKSFGSNRSSETGKQSKPNPSSPKPGFLNRSESISYQGSTKKKNLFFKTLQRSWSLGSWSRDMKKNRSSTSPVPSIIHRSKSIGRASSIRVVPSGCFTVCVGPNKERFIVKMICLNHPLFQALLQQAEIEFGFASDGPLMLPCEVQIFQEVMLEIEQQISPDNSPRCNFSRSPYRYGLISPSNFIVARPI